MVQQQNGLLDIQLNYNMDQPRNPNQTTNIAQPYGGRFWVHSNRHVPKMSSLGFDLFPGKLYTVYIKKVSVCD